MTVAKSPKLICLYSSHMFERRKGNWLVLGSKFTKSQPFSPLTNVSQVSQTLLLLASSRGSCSNLHRAKISIWLEGYFQKSNLCPAHRKQSVKCFQTQDYQRRICQLVVVPWCPGFSEISLSVTKWHDETSNFFRQILAFWIKHGTETEREEEDINRCKGAGN